MHFGKSNRAHPFGHSHAIASVGHHQVAILDCKLNIKCDFGLQQPKQGILELPVLYV